jgi:hypothetical protein
MKRQIPAAGIVLSAALAFGVAVLGCPGTLANKECFLQERDAHNVLVTSCIGTSCHNAKDMALGLDLETSGIGSRLKDKVTIACDGKTLVVPGDPDASALYGKLTDTPPCGSRMPLGQPALYPEDLEIIRVWIAGMNGSCSGEPSGPGGGSSTTSGTGGTSTGGAGGTSTGGAGGSGGAATGGAGGSGGAGGAATGGAGGAGGGL